MVPAQGYDPLSDSARTGVGGAPVLLSGCSYVLLFFHNFLIPTKDYSIVAPSKKILLLYQTRGDFAPSCEGAHRVLMSSQGKRSAATEPSNTAKRAAHVARQRKLLGVPAAGNRGNNTEPGCNRLAELLDDKVTLV